MPHDSEQIHQRKITMRRSGVSEVYIVTTLQDTKELAQIFSQQLKGGDVVALSGNLGSGKTTFTQCVARSLGVEEIVSSPTFVLMKIYNGDTLQLCHIDAYRLTSAGELEAIGVRDFLGESKAVTFIEWPEHVREIVPADAIHITFEILFAS